MGLAGKVSSCAVPTGHPGRRLPIVALVLVGALMAACEADPRTGPPPPDPGVVAREPPEVALFLDAYARDDEDTVDEVASPPSSVLASTRWTTR